MATFIVYVFTYELCKEKLKPEIQVSDLTWMSKNEIHEIEVTEKNSDLTSTYANV